jgi:hypothetical protein
VFGEILMSAEKASNQEETKNEQADAIAPEVLDRIKHPPAIDDAMRELSPEELMGNPAVVPEMLNEADSLRDDLKRD